MNARVDGWVDRPRWSIAKGFDRRRRPPDEAHIVRLAAPAFEGYNTVSKEVVAAVLHAAAATVSCRVVCGGSGPGPAPVPDGTDWSTKTSSRTFARRAGVLDPTEGANVTAIAFFVIRSPRPVPGRAEGDRRRCRGRDRG